MFNIQLEHAEALIVLKALDLFTDRGEAPIAEHDSAINLIDYIEAETGIRSR